MWIALNCNQYEFQNEYCNYFDIQTYLRVVNEDVSH